MPDASQMILHTTEVKPLPGYRLFLRFNYGAFRRNEFVPRKKETSNVMRWITIQS